MVTHALMIIIFVIIDRTLFLIEYLISRSVCLPFVVKEISPVSFSFLF